MTENKSVTEKSYSLSELSITSSNGKKFDVFSQLVELSIFEDIYSPTMSGTLTISDSIDLFSEIPLSGFEFLTISLEKPDGWFDVILSKTFRIYKMDVQGVNLATSSNQVYTLFFCSEENLISESRKISKSYKGKKISEIVKDIVENHLETSENKFFEENIDQTFGVFDIVIPYMTPLNAITWLSNRAVSSGSQITSANYLFYENNFGYNFKSIEKLFQARTKAKYTYRPKNIDTATEPLETLIFNAIRYDFIKVFDILSNVNSGMFSSKLLSFDILRQKVTEQNFNYNTLFTNARHVEPRGAPFHSQYKDRTGKIITENHSSVVKLYPTTKDHNTDSSITRYQPGIRPNLVENWLLSRISQLSQLNYFKLKLVVPGNMYVTVGDIIEFDVPLTTIRVSGEETYNPYHSGRYLITAVRHKIDIRSYEMIIEATRDCVSFNYPDSSLNDQEIDVTQG